MPSDRWYSISTYFIPLNETWLDSDEGLNTENYWCVQYKWPGVRRKRVLVYGSNGAVVHGIDKYSIHLSGIEKKKKLNVSYYKIVITSRSHFQTVCINEIVAGRGWYYVVFFRL